MQKSTIRTLFALGILAAVLLMALMVWDQFGNDGDLFLLFALTFAFLLFLMLLLLTARPDEARLLEFRPMRGPQQGRRTTAPPSRPAPRPARPAARPPPGPVVRVTRDTPAPLAQFPPRPAAVAAPKAAVDSDEDVEPEDDDYRPQCAALTADGQQCRNSARGGSKYCASHKGYQPPTAKGIVMRSDTDSQVAERDTKPSFIGDHVAATAKGSQCQSLTADGMQCKNTVVAGSQFCVVHKGSRSPTKEAVRASKDTKPRVAGAPDTKVAVRKSRK